MDSAQADVAGAALVASFSFEMVEESGDMLERKGLDSELAGIAVLPSGDELQQKFETVTITVERVWAQGALAGQVIGEEAV
jgi:hypothetical protein